MRARRSECTGKSSSTASGTIRDLKGNTVLCEAGKTFTRLEVWLYLTNVLAAGMDEEAAGIKHGEFIASVRHLSRRFNWSHGVAQRFIDLRTGDPFAKPSWSNWRKICR